ncbi:DUF397 domain-containing protein [Streptomyces albus]|uniref:DUF397 domain-containing protein n=1 Tax=Streptomyces albus TaxID=1888 RepID=UPI0024AE6F45|nr:DUF397 domain-containing protein [Streptomyces albus]MDI6410779.1 DUF397 domain-containing protein [Streptomyces albus]
MNPKSAPSAQSEFDGATWHKSTYSGSNNNCVERGILRGGRQAVRDTKDRSIAPLLFEAETWQSFINSVKQKDTQL